MEKESKIFFVFNRETTIDGFADDYAFLIRGLIDLYDACFDEKWLKWAEELQENQDKLFWDQNSGGYFNTSNKDPSILLRLKEGKDIYQCWILF